MKKATTLLAAAGVALAAAPGSLALAGSWSFTRLADTSGVIQQFQTAGAALNDNGDAAFVALLDNQEFAVVRADGQEETVIASTPEFFGFTDTPDINNAGLVGFGATVIIDENARPGVWVGDGETITVVGPPNVDPFGDNYVFWELDASGRALMAELAANSVPDGMAVGSGGPVTHLYDAVDFGGNGALFTGDLTDTGLTTVIASPGVGLRWNIYRGDVNRSAPVCIAGLQEFNHSYDALAANDGGAIAFIATEFVEKIGFQSGVYLWAGGPTGCDDDDDETYVEIAHQSGPFAVFDASGGPAVNDSETVVFGATLDDGGHGIFTGPDPEADRVIAAGDALDGAVADAVAMHRFGLNAAGQVAFVAFLSDGRQGIYLATPCPADLDGSGDVGFPDILRILSAWGPCGGCPEDLDGSGGVGFPDLLLVLSAWGPCP